MLTSLGTIYPAYAHSSKVVGDFKIEVGWQIEPPLMGSENSIELVISMADESDKLSYDMVFFNRLTNATIPATEKDILGLDKTIEATILTSGLKIPLLLSPNDKSPGPITSQQTWSYL